jgi:hypothetical protein
MKGSAHLLLSAVLLSSAQAASAADDSPEKEIARKRFADGLRYYDEAEFKHDPKLYNKAYMEFSGAYAVYPDDKVLWNLGLSEVDSGRYADGLQHLQLYDAHQHVLAHPTQAKYKVLHEYLQRANLAAGHLSITGPAGARVRVDGREVGVAPVTLAVDAGAHQVEVQTAAGVQTVTVRPSAGETATVNLEAPPPAAPLAAVPQDSLPGRVAPAPPHEPGTDTQPSFWTTRRDVGVGVAAAGVASLVLSGVFDAQAKSAANQAAALRGDSTACGSNCAALENAYSSQNSNATRSGVFLIVGIGAVAAGAAIFLWPTSPSASRTAVGPLLLPHGGGFQLQGEL